MEGISQSRPFNETTSLENSRRVRFGVFRPIGLETIVATHSKNLQLKPIRRRARTDGAAHRLQETR
jgi:hypothetical protein